MVIKKKKLALWGNKYNYHQVCLKVHRLSRKYKIEYILKDDFSNLSQDIDGVIISANRADHTLENNVWAIARKLRKMGVKHIYVIPATLERKPISKMRLLDIRNLIVPIRQFTEPQVVKFLAYEGCNLNCSGCSHFASINKNPKMLTLQELEDTLYKLKTKFTYVKNIQFLGGEPLLNKDLGEMIELTHKIFPYSSIGVITNGLLLLSIGNELMEKFREHKVFLAITQYVPTVKLVERIKERLDSYEIVYEFSDKITYFRLQYNSIGNRDCEENHRKCLDWSCHTIADGKIGGCYYAVTAKHANEYFGIDIPVESFSYDIDSDAYTGAELLEKLVSANELCAYCNSFPSPVKPWHQVDKNPTLEDWFFNDGEAF